MVGKDADIIVVGGGGSGLAAAAEVRRLGRSVLVIEKGPTVGGTTALSVGTIMAAGGEMQRQAGIEDSPAAHAKDLDDVRRAMGLDDDPELRKLLTENVADTVAFLRSIGVNFLAPLPQPPHTKPRMHQVMPTSRAYIFQLDRHCRKVGVDIRVNARAQRLVTENGRVVGVEVREGDAAPRIFRAGAIILASGDAAAKPDFLHKYMKSWTDGIEPFNPLSTADGHVMAEAIGARIVPRKDMPVDHVAHIRFVRPKPIWLQKTPPYPFLTRMMVLAMKILPQAVIRPFMMSFLTTTLGPDRGVYEQGAILVNKRGARFTRELELGLSSKIPGQPDGEAYLIFDERFAQKFQRFPYFISTAPGVAFAYVDDYRRARKDLFNRAPTAQALAQKIGFDPAKFAKSLSDANAAQSEDKQLREGPFYALGPIKTWAIVSQIGLAVNTRLEVLDDANTPIPGLYAAGGAGQAGLTITGHGHGLGWAFTSGRLAGREAAHRLTN